MHIDQYGHYSVDHFVSLSYHIDTLHSLYHVPVDELGQVDHHDNQPYIVHNAHPLYYGDMPNTVR